MKNTMNRMIAALMVLTVMTAALTGCKSKPKDADLKAAIETALLANPSTSGAMVTVDKGVATLNGTVADEAGKQAADRAAATIPGVKSVVNSLTVTPVNAAAPVAVAVDDTLTTAVKDATKDFPTVTATVSDGVITLKGEIQKANLQKLMMALQALKPKKVDNSQLVIK
jgi:hyperosmotically inducible protein